MVNYQDNEKPKRATYIPPHKRHQVIERNNDLDQTDVKNTHNYSNNNNGNQHNYNNNYTINESINLNENENNSLYEGNTRFPNLDDQKNVNTNNYDRYRNNNNNNNNNDNKNQYNNQRREYNNNQNNIRNKTSKTGTGWDIRDGRQYIRDDQEKVFGKIVQNRIGINFDAYDNIPVEVTGADSMKLIPMQNFLEIEGIHEILLSNIRKVKYERPTPVQKFSIPAISSGRDLMACAQTGSGKTAAFLFPIIMRMLQEGPPQTPYQSSLRTKRVAYPIALVLSPTRELAIQIYEESRKFCYNTGIRTNVLYGGSEVRTQILDLDKGSDIVVATPGRLRDLIDRGKIKLKLIKFLVLDEADRMLDMGFAPQIREIVETFDMLNSSDGRQTVMFSATFPREIQQLARDFLHSYIFLTVGRVGATSGSIVQKVMYAEEAHKRRLLIKLLMEQRDGLTVVFVEMKRRADQIEDFLIEQNFPAVSIHGDRSQSEREHALRLFRSGKRPILVATDVAARGLDIQNITHVINLDMPCNIDDYVHRIGRTGRAGNTGLATSFVDETNKPILRDLLAALEESDQDVPEWFQDMVKSCTASFGKYNTKSKTLNKPKTFSSIDIRSSKPNNSNNLNNNDLYSDQWRNDKKSFSNINSNNNPNNNLNNNPNNNGNCYYNNLNSHSNNSSHYNNNNIPGMNSYNYKAKEIINDDAW